MRDLTVPFSVAVRPAMASTCACPLTKVGRRRGAAGDHGGDAVRRALGAERAEPHRGGGVGQERGRGAVLEEGVGAGGPGARVGVEARRVLLEEALGLVTHPAEIVLGVGVAEQHVRAGGVGERHDANGHGIAVFVGHGRVAFA